MEGAILAHLKKAKLAILAKTGKMGAMAAGSAVSVAPNIGFPSVADLADVTASALKNKFGQVVRRALREPVAVTRHNRREFVILTAEQYEQLQGGRAVALDILAEEFDAMVASMHTPKDRAARAGFFMASAVKPSVSKRKAAKPSP